jgi:preprotein translocase subunit SecF
MSENTTHKKDDLIFIDFVKAIGICSTVSGLLVLIALFLILTKGFNYGIDFAGGAEVQVRFARPVAAQEIRDFTEQTGVRNAVVQQFGTGDSNEYLIRTDAKVGKNDKETNENLQASLKALQAGLKTKWPDAEIRRVDTVGPQVGNQLKRNGILAMFYSLLCILIYIGLRFDYKFAPGAVICLFHDAIITLGIFSLMGKEVNVTILAAILAIIGYSLNDTIVIFDRIRETLAHHKGRPLGELINRSINDTLQRTILTSLTTFLACLSLYLFAGGVVTDFGFAMMIGIAIGTYSSIYVASPFILLLDRFTKNSGRVAGRRTAKA